MQIIELNKRHPDFNIINNSFPFDGAIVSAFNVSENQILFAHNQPDQEIIDAITNGDVSVALSTNTSGALILRLQIALLANDTLTYDLPFNANSIPHSQRYFGKGNVFLFILVCRKTGIVHAMRLINLPVNTYLAFTDMAENQLSLTESQVEKANTDLLEYNTNFDQTSFELCGV